MIKNKDFIFTGLQPWDVSIGSNAIDIAKTVAKHNRVLYINTPLDYATYKYKDNLTDKDIQHRREVIKGEKNPLRKINESLFILDIPFTILPINKLPDGKLFDFFNYLNTKKVLGFVKKYIKELGFKDYILFTDNDIYRSFYAIDILKPRFSIYYRRDNMVSPFWAKHAKRLEPLICAKYDIVAANSAYLANMVKGYNINSFDIGQGVELKDYDPKKEYTKPQDIVAIPHPIIGYTGWVTNLRLDAELIYDIALRLPQYSFVFVGKEDEHFSEHKLHNLPNVYFLGLKEQSLMPSYISCFDIAFNPQKVNDITQGNYPRKVDEYLALGKKVIATKTEGMMMFDNYVWNCRNADEYIESISAALAESDEDKTNVRISFAKSHSWDNTVKKLYNLISI